MKYKGLDKWYFGIGFRQSPHGFFFEIFFYLYKLKHLPHPTEMVKASLWNRGTSHAVGVSFIKHFNIPEVFIEL
jgi:hypothetical protein